jgi:hypothetical protein
MLPEGAVDGSQVPLRDPSDLELLLASAVASSELTVELKAESDYQSPEDAIYALSEFSGLGYEAEFPIRASWLRAVKGNQNPFNRASELAINTYDSQDADLLPIREED